MRHARLLIRRRPPGREKRREERRERQPDRRSHRARRRAVSLCRTPCRVMDRALSRLASSGMMNLIACPSESRKRARITCRFQSMRTRDCESRIPSNGRAAFIRVDARELRTRHNARSRAPRAETTGKRPRLARVHRDDAGRSREPIDRREGRPDDVFVRVGALELGSRRHRVHATTRHPVSRVASDGDHPATRGRPPRTRVRRERGEVRDRDPPPAPPPRASSALLSRAPRPASRPDG